MFLSEIRRVLRQKRKGLDIYSREQGASEGPFSPLACYFEIIHRKVEKILWIPIYSPLRYSIDDILPHLLSHIYTDFTYFFFFFCWIPFESKLQISWQLTVSYLCAFQMRVLFCEFKIKDISVKFITYLNLIMRSYLPTVNNPGEHYTEWVNLFQSLGKERHIVWKVSKFKGIVDLTFRTNMRDNFRKNGYVDNFLSLSVFSSGQ